MVYVQKRTSLQKWKAKKFIKFLKHKISKTIDGLFRRSLVVAFLEEDY